MTTPALLDGLRLIEGSAFVAAPVGGMALAQLGADVIRFDRIGGGIDHDRWPVTEDGRSLYWAGLNKGKRSVAIDLASQPGRELVVGMIEDTGVFLTNFPVRGWMAYEALGARRRDLIMVSITGNRDGTTAVDYTVNAAMGYPFATGPENHEEPVNHVLPAWDLLCGQTAALGILAADRRRLRDGVGARLSIALSDVALATVSALGHVAEAQVNHESRSRYGNYLYGAFGAEFATADGRRLYAVAISDRQWTALVEATRTSDAMTEIETEMGLDLGSAGDRFRGRVRIRDAIQEWIGPRSLSDVASRFDGLGVCWGAYQTFAELVARDPRCSVGSGLFAEVDQPGIGRYLVPGSPIAVGGVPPVEPAPAPLLGEHTDEVLAELLGLSDVEIGRLHDRAVVAGPAID